MLPTDKFEFSITDPPQEWGGHVLQPEPSKDETRNSPSNIKQNFEWSKCMLLSNELFENRPVMSIQVSDVYSDDNYASFWKWAVH